MFYHLLYHELIFVLFSRTLYYLCLQIKLQYNYFGHLYWFIHTKTIINFRYLRFVQNERFHENRAKQEIDRRVFETRNS